jgi:hypothetical protein
LAGNLLCLNLLCLNLRKSQFVYALGHNRHAHGQELIQEAKPPEAYPAYWAPFVVVGEGVAQ